MTTAVFKSSSEARSQTGTSYADNGEHSARRLFLVNAGPHSEPSPSASLLDATVLYPTIDSGDHVVIRAVRTLDEVERQLKMALAIDPESDYITFDTHLMKSRILLQSAFDLRQISDGFAAVVNAIGMSLKNQEAGIVTKRQLNALIEAVVKTRRGPFMHFDSAMLILDDLEDSGLAIEPAEMDDLMQVDYGEGIRRNDAAH